MFCKYCHAPIEELVKWLFREKRQVKRYECPVEKGGGENIRYYDLVKNEFVKQHLNAPTETCWLSDSNVWIKVLKFTEVLGHPLRHQAVGKILRTNATDVGHLRKDLIQEGFAEVISSPFIETIKRIEPLFEAIPDDVELFGKEASDLSAAMGRHVKARRVGDLALWAESEQKITAVLTSIKERLPNEMPVVKKTIFQGVLCRVKESLP